MKKLLVIIFLLLIIFSFSRYLSSGNKKANVYKIYSCIEDYGYAWCDGIVLLDNNGFGNTYVCKFPIGTTCKQIKNANRIEIIGQGFMYKECIIIN